jgi:ABC-type nitrate/sulfonate/bicarbonate transport system substrate-binding protein
MRFNWVPGVDFMGWYAAQKFGWYKQQHINFEFTPGGPNVPPATNIVAGGGADVSLANVYEILKSRQQGKTDFVMIGAKFQSSPLAMISLPRNPIRKASDICGKRIVVGQSDVLFLNGLLKANGLKPDCYKQVPGGYDPAPLVRNQADGYVGYSTNQPITLADRGVKSITVTFAQMGQPLYADVIFAKKDFVTKNHDALVRWMRATIQGWNWVFKHPQQAIDMMMNDYGGKDAGEVAADQLPQWKATAALMQSGLTKQKGLFSMSPALVGGKMYAGLKQTDVTAYPPVNEFVDTSILSGAYAGHPELILK